MSDIKQKARELLAAEYEREGILYMSDLLRARGEQLTPYEERAVRAIEAALRTSTPRCQHDWQTGYGVAPYCSHCGATGGEGTRTPDAGGRDALIDRITDYLCDQEYDIGGRDELRANVAAAIAQREGS